MQKQRKGSQETIVEEWGRALVPPLKGYIHKNWIYNSESKKLRPPTQVEGGNFRLSTARGPQTGWNQKADD